MELREIGEALRHARMASGLSQAELATLVGVSRATINALETGNGDTVASTILTACDVLGIRLEPSAATSAHPTNSLEWAAASASTSYRTAMHTRDLQAALASGQVPTQFVPHLAYIVNELSDARLLRIIRDTSMRSGKPPKRVWRNARRIADELMSPHPRWRNAQAR